MIQNENDILMMDGVSMIDIANEYGTPCYVYSKNYIEERYFEYKTGFGERSHMICFSVKSNSNLSVLKILKDLGAGFDVVSGGELSRVLAIGASPDKIVFSGVGKTRKEIIQGLKAQISCFNVESKPELVRIESIAREMGVVAPVSIRVNPDIDSGSHPYISTGLKENKFGIDINKALGVYKGIDKSEHLKAVGVDCHIGSQLTDFSPFIDAIEKVTYLLEKLDAVNIKLDHIDLGGGLGVNYKNETPLDPEEFAINIVKELFDRDEMIIIEPGRSIVANAGVFLTKIEYIKETPAKNFCIVDGAMNDLVRPSLYGSWQDIKNTYSKEISDPKTYDVVGPVCETGDFLGKDRKLSIQSGDVLAVLGAGAYGYVMSSNYNTRGKVAEVLIFDNTHKIIKPRETVEQLFADELDKLD